jgi:two-component system, chemotaxis family, protein-glutamate methylesterase/glutaminase
MAQDSVNRIIAIGGSAGSLEVIMKIVQSIPTYTGNAYIIIVHRKNDAESILEELLKAKTILAVTEVEDKEFLEPDHIYLAPSNYHLLLEDQHQFSLDSSEKIHFSRPSIDVTFESLAEIFGEKVIGILLSGANSDGVSGLQRIKKAGGLSIVQDPATAEVSFMPEQAILANAFDKIATPDEMIQMLAELT